MITTERTLYLQTRSGKQFLVKESGEIRALNSNEKCGLMLGLVRRPGDKLTLLPKVFSMFDELSDEELLRQLASCMSKPNRWLVIANMNGKPLYGRKEKRSAGFACNEGASGTGEMKSKTHWADADMLPVERVMGKPEALI